MDWLYWFRNSHYCRIKSCKTILELHKGEERMNDFVLRGFCQKCECPLQFCKEDYLNHMHTVVLTNCKRAEPVWFLSPKQMKIILFSEEFNKIYLDSNYKSYLPFLIHSLDTNPFLVAKILSDAGKDS